MHLAIKNIVAEEFFNLIRAIETDFSKNYHAKVNNFLLSQFDSYTVASMVFVSSFESKSGFAIEDCARRVARLKFGEDNVPAVVNPRGLRYDESVVPKRGQVVVTDVDTNSGNLHGEIAAFRANHVALGRGRNRVESRVTHESCKAVLLPLSIKYRQEKIYAKPVDLAFFDGNDWNIMELKAGGDLDSSNAPANVEKLLTIFTDIGVENCKAYFATIYNKDREGNVWSGTVKKHLHYPSMFLIGKDFWEKILPSGISFYDFKAIYEEALNEIDLNSHIKAILKECTGV